MVFLMLLAINTVYVVDTINDGTVLAKFFYGKLRAINQGGNPCGCINSADLDSRNRVLRRYVGPPPELLLREN